MGHGMARGDKAGRGESDSWKPVLGIGDPREGASARPDWRERTANAGLSNGPGAVPGTVFDQPEPEELIELTVIVPARNEEDCLGACLESLVSQSEEIFELGKDWELIVVDDHSTDRTAEIARGICRSDRDGGGASWSRAGRARTTPFGRRRGGPGAAGCSLPMRTRSTSRATCGTAMHEAERHKVGMLSYSPRQIVQRLRAAVADAAGILRTGAGLSAGQSLRSGAAHCGGQRAVSAGRAGGLSQLGGHASVAGKVLEDVELAFLAKRRRVGLRFRYADDAVSARMYRTTAAMIEGWTKNLQLLFNNALVLAMWRALDILLLFGLPVLACELWNARLGAHGLEWLGAGWVLALLWLRTLFRFYGGWPSRIFRFWIARCRRWACRCLSRCSIAAGFSTGF